MGSDHHSPFYLATHRVGEQEGRVVDRVLQLVAEAQGHTQRLALGQAGQHALRDCEHRIARQRRRHRQGVRHAADGSGGVGQTDARREAAQEDEQRADWLPESARPGGGVRSWP